MKKSMRDSLWLISADSDDMATQARLGIADILHR
jgi:hypothetical protein